MKLGISVRLLLMIMLFGIVANTPRMAAAQEVETYDSAMDFRRFQLPETGMEYGSVEGIDYFTGAVVEENQAEAAMPTTFDPSADNQEEMPDLAASCAVDLLSTTLSEDGTSGFDEYNTSTDELDSEFLEETSTTGDQAKGHESQVETNSDPLGTTFMLPTADSAVWAHSDELERYDSDSYYTAYDAESDRLAKCRAIARAIADVKEDIDYRVQERLYVIRRLKFIRSLQRERTRLWNCLQRLGIKEGSGYWNGALAAKDRQLSHFSSELWALRDMPQKIAAEIKEFEKELEILYNQSRKYGCGTRSAEM